MKKYQFDIAGYILSEPLLNLDLEDKTSYVHFLETATSSEIKLKEKEKLECFTKEDVKEIYFTLEDKRHGHYIKYEKEKKALECFYKHGVLHGPSSTYIDGKLLSINWFFEGKQEGESLFFYPSGNLMYQEYFFHGEKQGLQLYYYENQTLEASITYQQGKLHGETKLYYPNGALKRSFHMQLDAKHGEEKIYNLERELIDEGSYQLGKPVGLHRRLYSKHRVMEEIIYHTPSCYAQKKWNLEGNLVFESRYDENFNYQQATFKQNGEALIERGRWIEDRLVMEIKSHD